MIIGIQREREKKSISNQDFSGKGFRLLSLCTSYKNIYNFVF